MKSAKEIYSPSFERWLIAKDLVVEVDDEVLEKCDELGAGVVVLGQVNAFEVDNLVILLNVFLHLSLFLIIESDHSCLLFDDLLYSRVSYVEATIFQENAHAAALFFPYLGTVSQKRVLPSSTL